MDRTFTWLIFISCFLHSPVAIQGFNWEIDYIHELLTIAINVDTNDTWRAAWEENVVRAESGQPINVNFLCTIYPSPSNPTSVHEVRPSDIKVIGALGSSITTGMALQADQVFEVSRQLRGEAWSIGGDHSLEAKVLTLPNILRKYNAGLFGYSTGYGADDTEPSRLNRAVMGSHAEHLLDQAEEFIRRTSTDPNINFQEDWKLLTILIGANDICSYCKDRVKYSPDEYERHLTETLDLLHANVPRMLINLVPQFDLSPIKTVSQNFVCDAFHEMSCPCALDSTTMPEVRSIQLQYYQRLKNIVESGRYDIRDNFTVIMQPHMVRLEFPKDINTGKVRGEYFASDCFHLSRLGQQALAYMLWNTMFTPVGQKPTRYPMEEKVFLRCPSERYPYIFTWKNSEGASVPGPGGTDPPVTKPIKQKNYKLETILIYSVVGLGGLLTAIIFMGTFVPLLKPKSKSKKGIDDDETGSQYSVSISRTASLAGSVRRERPEGESARNLLPRNQVYMSVDNNLDSASLDNLDEAATLGHQTDV